MRLTRDEIYLILELLREKYGPGYSDKPEIGSLQAKLSIMGEVAAALAEAREVAAANRQEKNGGEE